MDSYRPPKWELGDYLTVKYGPNGARVGRVVGIESFDSGVTPIYTLRNIGREYEFNLALYTKGVSK